MQKAELHTEIRRGKNYSYPIGCLLSRKILSLQRLSANLGFSNSSQAARFDHGPSTQVNTNVTNGSFFPLLNCYRHCIAQYPGLSQRQGNPQSGGNSSRNSQVYLI